MLMILLKRLLVVVPTVFVVTVVTFSLSTLIPADPAQIAAGLEAGPAQVERVRKELGLDRPVYEQYGRYVWRLMHGDFGRSMMTRRPVLEDLRKRLPATIELTLLVMVIYITISIPIGVYCAVHRGSLADRLIRPLSVGLAAIPVFWLALLLQLLFYSTLRLLPATGILTRFAAFGVPQRVTGMILLDSLLAGNFAAFFDAAKHLVLPVFTLVVGRLPVAIKQTRASMVQALEQQFITTAHSKGIRQRTVVWKHALKYALIPVVTMLGLQFGWLLGGTVLVEAVFGLPGLGEYMVSAVVRMDVQPIMGGTIVLALVFIFVNAVVDVLYMFLDPRIRIS